jgi:hypothetical protein
VAQCDIDIWNEREQTWERCTRRASTRVYCNAHYQRLRLAGVFDPEEPQPLPYPLRERSKLPRVFDTSEQKLWTCYVDVDGHLCGLQALDGNGLCVKHEQELLAAAKKRPQPPRRTPRSCNVEGCPNVHYAKGKCRNHYMQQYNRRHAKQGVQGSWAELEFTWQQVHPADGNYSELD